MVPDCLEAPRRILPEVVEVAIFTLFNRIIPILCQNNCQGCPDIRAMTNWIAAKQED